VLRGAGLLDEAHAAMHLHAERGDLDADVGGPGLGDRVRSGARRGAELARPASHRSPDARVDRAAVA
jgi:hypothetical protein